MLSLEKRKLVSLSSVETIRADKKKIKSNDRNNLSKTEKRQYRVNNYNIGHELHEEDFTPFVTFIFE